MLVKLAAVRLGKNRRSIDTRLWEDYGGTREHRACSAYGISNRGQCFNIVSEAATRLQEVSTVSIMCETFLSSRDWRSGRWLWSRL